MAPILSAALTLVLVDVRPAAATHGTTTRESVSVLGGDPNGRSDRVVISLDGDVVAFESSAENLVVPDRHRVATDVFWRNIVNDETRMVSTDFNNRNEPNGKSTFPAPSCDGRYVAFMSNANNLVAGDNPDLRNDIFRRDVHAGVTEKVSVTYTGAPPNNQSTRPSISCDGSLVAFISHAGNLVPGDTNGKLDVFVRDMVAGVTTRLSESDGQESDGESTRPILSGDGRYVVFQSDASNLVPGDTNGKSDIFRVDVATGTIVRASVTHRGGNINGISQRPWISHDGRYVSFQTPAGNVVPGDTNARYDVFLRDLTVGTTVRVSMRHDGTPTTGECTRGVVSGDGRYVAATCADTRIVPGDTNRDMDVFLWNLQTGAVERLNVNNADEQGDCPPPDGGEISFRPSINHDGRVIAFRSSHCNLVPDDGNGLDDIYVRSFR
ncbi:MAG: TolB family protein [Acidimicrobiales bacterium]